MANDENLKPAVKGEPSRNPNGRPKGSRNRSTFLREILATKMKAMNPLTGKEQKMEVEKILDLKLVQSALMSQDEGIRLKAAQMVKETIYGKIPQDLNIGGQEENPVVIEQKVASLSTLERLIVKYGIDSENVKKYQEKYGIPEEETETEADD